MKTKIKKQSYGEIQFPIANGKSAKIGDKVWLRDDGAAIESGKPTFSLNVIAGFRITDRANYIGVFEFVDKSTIAPRFCYATKREAVEGNACAFLIANGKRAFVGSRVWVWRKSYHHPVLKVIMGFGCFGCGVKDGPFCSYQDNLAYGRTEFKSDLYATFEEVCEAMGAKRQDFVYVGQRPKYGPIAPIRVRTPNMVNAGHKFVTA